MYRKRVVTSTQQGNHKCKSRTRSCRWPRLRINPLLRLTTAKGVPQGRRNGGVPRRMEEGRRPCLNISTMFNNATIHVQYVWMRESTCRRFNLISWLKIKSKVYVLQNSYKTRVSVLGWLFKSYGDIECLSSGSTMASVYKFLRQRHSETQLRCTKWFLGARDHSAFSEWTALWINIFCGYARRRRAENLPD